MDFLKKIKDENKKTEHREIIEKLLDGCFINPSNNIFDFLVENKKWYTDFFNITFGAELLCQEEIFYLVHENKNKNSKFASRVLTVLAILIYELDNQGINAINQIKDKEYTIDTLNSYLISSVQFSSLAEDYKFDKNFLSKLEKKGIVKKLDDEKFKFNEAINVFISQFEDLKYQVPQLDKTNEQ